jgi:hypothetical protein
MGNFGAASAGCGGEMALCGPGFQASSPEARRDTASTSINAHGLKLRTLIFNAFHIFN